MSRERILRELAILQEGNQVAELLTSDRDYVVYRDVPTGGARKSLPSVTDVIVPVPGGYPAAPIDLAGLPQGSALLPHLKGGQNNQGVVKAGARTWQLASYHPHQNGGAGPWDQNRHGFHTYFDSLIAWLERVD
jgi:hypothetical protein